jgi:thiol:disulfide interchange protein DsbA
MRVLILSILLCCTTQLWAAEGSIPLRYVEGEHYTVLPEPVSVQVPEKIEVVEVFWYACSHCFRLETAVRNYKENLADDINFVAMPAIWQPIMEVHARIFYTAQELGVLETVHQGVFNAIHLDRKPLQNADEVADLFATYGIDKDKVIKTFNSGAVTDRLKKDFDKVRDYKITGTPQLIVQGRYRVEANKVLSQSDMFNVVDFLVSKVRPEQKDQAK